MEKFIVGAMFGFIFAWLWWHRRHSRHSAQESANLAARDKTISQLQAQLSTAAELGQTKNQALTIELEQLRSQISADNGQMQSLQAELAQKNTLLADVDSTVSTLKADLETCSSELQNIRPQLAAKQTELDSLQTKLTTCQERSQSLQSELDTKTETLTEALENAQADLATKADLVINLQHELDTLRTSQSNIANKHEDDDEEVDIEALKASLPKAVTEPDNLKKIKGIASVIEGLLNDLGITTFKQITLLNDTQVKQVSKALKTFPDRMYRDHWMEQARELHRQKYDEDI